LVHATRPRAAAGARSSVWTRAPGPGWTGRPA